MKFLFSSIFILLFVSCTDPCKDLDCRLGFCEDGICICPEGYEGENCQLETRSFYYGTFYVTSAACLSMPVDLNGSRLVITEGDGGISSMKVGFVNRLKTDFINGHLDGQTLSAAGQIEYSNITSIAIEVDYSQDRTELAGTFIFNDVIECEIALERR